MQYANQQVQYYQPPTYLINNVTINCFLGAFQSILNGQYVGMEAVQ